MLSILWTRLLLEAQGYYVTDNIIYQYNKSAILLENNGKASSGKRTKHINMRYFFVTDPIQKGDVSVEWCPTGYMTGGFFTKLNQGSHFKRFRNVIMGIVEQPDTGPGNPKVSMKKGVKKFFLLSCFITARSYAQLDHRRVLDMHLICM